MYPLLINLRTYVVGLCLIASQGFCNPDSLKQKLNEKLDDTTRVKVLLRLSGKCLDKGEIKEALQWAQQGATLAEKINFDRVLGAAYNSLGLAYVTLSDYPRGLEYHKKALRKRIERNDKAGIAGSYNNIGIIYYNLADFPKTLEYFQKSLKMQEELKNERYIAATIGNIAVVYENLHEDSLSLVYQQRSFQMHKRMNNRSDMVASLNNLATLNRKKKKYSDALDQLKQALQLAIELDEKDGLQTTYANLGSLYLETKQPQLALEMFLKAKIYCDEKGDKKDVASLYNLLGNAYNVLGEKQRAIEFYKQSYNLAKSFGNLVEQQAAAENLFLIYKSGKDLKTAIDYLETSRQLKDSIFNSGKNESLNSLKIQFALDRQETLLNNKAQEERKKQEDEKSRQRIIIYTGVIVLALVLIFSYFLFQRFRITNRQNKIIENQKILVEEKNKEITDSILYARRLQQAIIPPAELVRELFPASFIFFKPKDIIAGDFYWMEQKHNDVYLAVADCTGHGVPGAMVSVVCSNALNSAIKEFALNETGDILTKTRELVLETFAKSGEEIKDGMDICLVRFINLNAGTGEIRIQYSGANNPLWYFRGNEFHAIKADKQPIGKTDLPLPFQTHDITLQKNDSIYLFTDGYADQFGGPKGKKFKYKQLEDILKNVHADSATEQLAVISKKFNDWKGSLEQVDDVCILGLKLS